MVELGKQATLIQRFYLGKKKIEQGMLDLKQLLSNSVYWLSFNMY